MYAPKSPIELNGGSLGTGTAGVQTMSWRFDIGGEGTLNMPLDPDQVPIRIIKGLVQSRSVR